MPPRDSFGGSGADINLNTRLRLPRAVAIISSSQLRGVPKAIPPRPRDQGSLLAKGGPAQSPVWMENSNDAAVQLDALDLDGRMLAIVLNSVLGASKLSKPRGESARGGAATRAAEQR